MLSLAGHVVLYGGHKANNWERFTTAIETTFGVLDGHGHKCKHAVHHRYGYIWDPDGHHYTYSRGACEGHGFYPNRLWIFTTKD